MPAECPQCRRRIPWTRTFFTTAWGRWRCEGCGSLLGINVARRLALALGGAALIVLVVERLGSLGFGYVVALPTVIAAFGLLLYFLDSAVVHERVGFRCRSCGYDLQGQKEPRCPECGAAFEPPETGFETSPDPHREPVSSSAVRSRRATVIMVVIMVFLVGAQILGIVVFRTRARTLRAAPEVKPVLEAVRTFAAAHEGRGPQHTIQLTLDGYLTPMEFVAFDSLTAAESVPLGDVSLAQFDQAPPEQKQAIAQAIIERLPQEIIAHRLGDFVFTYHGIGLATPDPNLWVVVWSPDPSQNPRPKPEDALTIGLAGGDIITHRLAELPERWAAQNRLRTDLGLPPLTRLSAVTHANPMVPAP